MNGTRKFKYTKTGSPIHKIYIGQRQELWVQPNIYDPVQIQEESRGWDVKRFRDHHKKLVSEGYDCREIKILDCGCDEGNCPCHLF